jgi:predicted  nucleic acid-binding Zn-ribbon protein
MLSGCPDCGGNTFQFHPADINTADEPSTEKPSKPEGGQTTNRVGRAATKVREFVNGSAKDEPDQAVTESTPADRGEPLSATGTATTNASTPDTEPSPDAPWPSDIDAEPATNDSEIIDADARREAAEGQAQSSARGRIASSDDVADSNSSITTEEMTASSDPIASGGATSESTVNGSLPDDGRVVSEPTGEQPDLDELRQQLNEQFESIKIVKPGQYELNLMELYNREEYIIALQENGRYVIQVPENWLGDRPGDDRS